MAEDFIEEIYSKAEIIFEIKKAITYCQKEQTFLFHKLWLNLQNPIAELCKSLVSTDLQFGSYIWNELLVVSEKAQNNEYTTVADKLEELIPYLYKAISLYGKIDVTEGTYRLFSTKSGYLGIQNSQNNHFLCSSIDPLWEAYEKASKLYIPTMKNFCTFGCSLGYLCQQMYEFSNQSIDIFIYDTDRTMYDYATNYGVISNIPNEKIHLIVNSDIRELIHSLRSNIDSFITSETVLYVEKDVYDKVGENQIYINDILSATESRNSLSGMCEQNFYRNITNVHKYIDDFKLTKKSKNFIIVGGGPSVDYCINYIKQNISEKVIVAATTIYNRLINEGIKPDIIVCSDPQNRTYGHLSDATDTSVPLIMDNMSNWQFGEKYPGEKYLIPSTEYYFAQKYYKKTEKNLWPPRGTVTGTCIDVAAYLGAKEIELVGMDLSYPGNHTHAEGTMDNKEINHDSMIEVPSVNGGSVYTRENFKRYISGIEDQIKKYNHITFYNLSKDGALIKGAKHQTF